MLYSLGEPQISFFAKGQSDQLWNMSAVLSTTRFFVKCFLQYTSKVLYFQNARIRQDLVFVNFFITRKENEEKLQNELENF